LTVLSGNTSTFADLMSCFGASYYTHIASDSHLTWKVMSVERHEIICVSVACRVWA
jgi:hypothetical protein